MISRFRPMPRNVTALVFGDPPPDLERRRQEAERRPSVPLGGARQLAKPERKLA